MEQHFLASSGKQTQKLFSAKTVCFSVCVKHEIKKHQELKSSSCARIYNVIYERLTRTLFNTLRS